ncbi:hypothetical protein Ddye_031597 [Dipteronia dyeriana]|uniref:HAT C-terminal dimerisation domain-containing protein n=1 Tax=Dipteronia dyeriana TaxID=168575 RepID=A0AAD9TJT6_9ROSI|nr:hypothetical protein Ddye_031597 [Dipteronia dyeriana]
MVLTGEFMHLRCCANIINLIVKEGLEELDESIASIRNVVKYIRSSLSRLKKFKSCVNLEKIDCGRVDMMNVPTRWNLTYFMLETALIFQKAFERMEDNDKLYNAYFNESEIGREREGPLNMMYWDKAKKKLKERKLDIGAQNEGERYLLEPTADINNKNYDILSLWKLHGTTYPTLSQIARDIFVILVPTVASESAFST